jgi:hypothetical protein
MTEVTGFAQLAVRAADLADRCEAAGALVAAAVLRGIAADVVARTEAALQYVVRAWQAATRPQPPAG